MSHRVILMLGSNVGERMQYIQKALGLIKKDIGAIENVSQLYETEPWGFDCAEWFLNQAVTVKTDLSPEDLLSTIHFIELELGRIRPKGHTSYMSRSIDIDILFYDQKIMHTPFLTIPHPETENRRFVLLPLNEIAGNFKHPLSGKTPKDMLDTCQDTSVVVLHKPDISKTAHEI